MPIRNLENSNKVCLEKQGDRTCAGFTRSVAGFCKHVKQP